MRSVSKNLLPAGLKAFLESRGWRCKFPGNDIEFSKDGTTYVFRPLEDVHDPAPLHRAVLCQDPQEAPLLLAGLWHDPRFKPEDYGPVQDILTWKLEHQGGTTCSSS